MGCELGQGFYFAKPMDSASLRHALRSGALACSDAR